MASGAIYRVSPRGPGGGNEVPAARVSGESLSSLSDFSIFPMSGFTKVAARLGKQVAASPAPPRIVLSVENPLYKACSLGEVQTVKKLLKKGDDPRSPGQKAFGLTSFHAAFFSKNPGGVLAVLLAYEARKCFYSTKGSYNPLYLKNGFPTGPKSAQDFIEQQENSGALLKQIRDEACAVVEQDFNVDTDDQKNQIKNIIGDWTTPPDSTPISPKIKVFGFNIPVTSDETTALLP